LIGLLIAAMSASADMAEHAQRSQVDGIDLITYVTGVKDVVIIVGALPAGDAFSGAGNAAVPTLTGMMLDRGTRSLDQFAIAQQLESVGAEISFGVGMQSLEIHAKCLKKDLPLVIGIIAAELRTPALSAVDLRRPNNSSSACWIRRCRVPKRVRAKPLRAPCFRRVIRTARIRSRNS